MTVTVSPPTFTMVKFDGAEIAAIGERILKNLGVDGPLEIEVNQTTPLGHTRVDSLDPLRIYAESGAFEDVNVIGELDPANVADVLGRLLIRVRDRREPGFADAPSDVDLDLAHSAAWDSYSVGRLAHLDFKTQRPRRRYQFLLRHGFTDVADQAFNKLWNATDLSWADIVAISDNARAAA